MRIRKHKKIDWVGQILVIVLPILFFLSAAVISKWSKGQTVDFTGSIITVLIMDGIYAVGLGRWLAWRIEIPFWKKRKSRRNWKWLIFVLLYSAGIRIIQLGDIQRWDASAYYIAIRNGCEGFAFTLSSFVNGFSVASHPTWGYLGILGIGEFLYEGNVAAVQFVNLILTLICVYCLYCIMEKMLEK